MDITGFTFNRVRYTRINMGVINTIHDGDNIAVSVQIVLRSFFKRRTSRVLSLALAK